MLKACEHSAHLYWTCRQGNYVIPMLHFFGMVGGYQLFWLLEI